MFENCDCPIISIFQEKRSLFPRFYFIGDEDLLEILGQATNPLVIQTHLKKLFAGIHNVDFDEGCQHIMAMKSLDGEVVTLENPVTITDEVEVSCCCSSVVLLFLHIRFSSHCNTLHITCDTKYIKGQSSIYRTNVMQG